VTSFKALQILAKRRAKSQKWDPSIILKDAFPQQRNFIEDKSKLKALFCTRRASKSYTAGLYMIYEALSNPNCNILFIGLTRMSAKNIVWKDILTVINNKHKLGGIPHKTDLSVTFPNGSVIRVAGVDTDQAEMNKLLGSKYRLVCIDEASMYTIDLRNLVYGILKPAMVDPNLSKERGTICMMGTSSNFTRGLFYDVTTSRETGWTLHTWSAHDNPYVAKQWQEELDEIKEKRPLYMETPQYKQWYLNRWVVDEEKLVYRFNEDRNLYLRMPVTSTNPSKLNEGWTYVLGVDIGWEDDNGFVLTGYHINDPTLYIIKTFKKPKMTFDDVVDKIQTFMKDPLYAPHKVIIDGANKQGVESMRHRSHIPFEYADKQGKVDFIEMMNSDMIQGNIKFSGDCSDLINEMMSLVWQTDGDRIKIPKKEHPALPNHLCDALLYAWRMGYHFQSEPAKTKAVIGSREWYAEQAEGIWERERKKIETDNNRSDWPDDDAGWGMHT
jgi:phage terminase large subunit